jgi:hypothetical protein
VGEHYEASVGDMKRNSFGSDRGWDGTQAVGEPVSDELPGGIGVVGVDMLGAAFRDQ